MPDQEEEKRLPAKRAEIRAPSRLRRTLLVAVALVLAAAAGVAGVVVLTDTGSEDPAGTAAETVPAAVIPDLVVPAPVLADDSGDEPLPDPAALATLLATTVSDPRLGGRLLARVVDVTDGQVLFDSAGDQPGTPASNAKLLTAFAALSTLDPGDRLSTRVVADTELGQIVLIGGGDTTLSRTAPSLSYPGAPTVADLAQQVLGNAAGQITSILVDGSLYTGPSVPPEWRSGDAPSTYAAPITATMVDGGRVAPGSRSRSATPDLDAGAALPPRWACRIFRSPSAPPQQRPTCSARSNRRRWPGWSKPCCRSRTTCWPNRWPARSRWRAASPGTSSAPRSP